MKLIRSRSTTGSPDLTEGNDLKKLELDPWPRFLFSDIVSDGLLSRVIIWDEDDVENSAIAALASISALVFFIS